MQLVRAEEGAENVTSGDEAQVMSPGGMAGAGGLCGAVSFLLPGGAGAVVPEVKVLLKSIE